MSNLQNASLVLSTQNGIYNNAGRTSITWNNINLRTLLGDMYDKYEIFNLCLNTMASGETLSFTPTQDDRQVLIRMSGLPFINNGYNVGPTQNTNTQNTIIGSFQFNASGVNTQYFYSANLATFDKHQELCNITIEYLKVSNLQYPSVSGVGYFPATTFIFDIFGIEKDKGNENGTRMIK